MPAQQKNIPQTVRGLADDISLRSFRGALLHWYSLHRRDLPWRKDRDPYRVWLSEIMLQQTRVAFVIEYYERFLEKFPTVQALAAARISSVLAAWSGLGYYRRARALHAAAKVIVAQYDGRFPSTIEELEQLPGIGKYTSAAIASIAFNKPAAVVDGNVERVLQRMIGKACSKQELWQYAGTLLSPDHAGDFNQAMMELGATVCLPGDPKCLVCPVMAFCSTRGTLAIEAAPARRKRELHYSLNLREGKVFLRQRAESASLMPGMWELPEIEPNGHKPEFSLRHSITNTDYRVHVVRGAAAREARGRWLTAARAQGLPLTGLTRKILRAAQFI
jgi:A/G-specific adenine glycosylase